MINVIETEVWKADPKIKGLLVKDRDKTIKEVYKEAVEFLKERNLYDELDYFEISSVTKEEATFPDWIWMACYAVVGSSEGHYIHVDAIDRSGQRELIFLGKTFNGMGYALKVANMLSKVFYEEIRE